MKCSNLIRVFAMAIIPLLVLTGCTDSTNKTDVSAKEIDSLKNEILIFTSGNDTIASHLKTFDTLDFTVFSNQEWSRLHESHSLNVIVHWPDGHITYGIERHISDLKALFVYAPDTKIKVHPIRFGDGDLTAVTGVMTGTFTKPMPVGNGKFIQPTGKSFSLPMCTIGLWNNGTMSEDYLFWDSKTYLAQMGIGN